MPAMRKTESCKWEQRKIMTECQAFLKQQHDVQTLGKSLSMQTQQIHFNLKDKKLQNLTRNENNGDDSVSVKESNIQIQYIWQEAHHELGGRDM